MFIHSFRYSLKSLSRDRVQVFWCALFPILLATLFYFAFGNLDASEEYITVPVAVVLQDEGDTLLKETLDSLSTPGENQLLEITYTSQEEAERMLEAKDIIGILTEKEKLELTVSAKMESQKLYQSILKVFVEQFNLCQDGVKDVMSTHPERMQELVSQLSKEVNYLTEESFTEGNFSEMLTYFFNLIAMSCLYASFFGNTIANYHQANLSSLGARRAISPVRKLISVAGGLCAALILEVLFVLISVCYMKFVLAVDFGSVIAYVFLTVLIGTMCGVSLGFFVGSIGTGSADLKFGILISVSMICCAFSGLMFGQIQIYIDQVFPIFNRINPAALISNSLYSLVIYPSHERLFMNLLILFAETMLFGIGGLLFIRRRKYASL